MMIDKKEIDRLFCVKLTCAENDMEWKWYHQEIRDDSQVFIHIFFWRGGGVCLKNLIEKKFISELDYIWSTVKSMNSIFK